MGLTCSRIAGTGEQYKAGRKPEVSGSPPLVPPKMRKKKLIPDPDLVFKDVDSHARSAPNHLTNSVADLAGYLTRGCHSDVQKARAVFVWLAYNIAYDPHYLYSSHKQPQDAGTVLRRRLAVCQGYSELCKALCDSAGLPCLVVSGFAKGYGYQPGAAFTVEDDANHAWNLVHVHNQWRPLECTWGAGLVGDDKKFQRQFEDFWFLTDPDHFLLRHFPYMNRDLASSASYQLTHKPLTLAQFSALAHPTPHAHKHAVRLLSHPSVHIEVRRKVRVKIKAGSNPLTSASAYLVDRANGGQDRSCVMTTLHPDGACDILVRTRHAGSFLLKIFGKFSAEEGDTLKELTTYVITCHEGPADFQPYPDNISHYGYHLPEAEECGLRKVKVVTSSLEAKEGEVQVRVPLSRATSLGAELRHAEGAREDLNNFTFIDHTQEAAVIRARLPRAGYYLLRLFAARHLTDQQLLQVADFLLHAAQDNTHLPAFPKSYKFQHKFHARLLQPLAGRVARDAASVYRVHAPDLATVKVGNTQLTQRGGVWEGQVTPERGMSCLTMHGAPTSEPGVLWRMFDFVVVSSRSAK